MDTLWKHRETGEIFRLESARLHPTGGGKVLNVNVDDLDALFEPADAASPFGPLERAVVSGEWMEGKHFRCWARKAEHWNGFGKPLFEPDVAAQLAVEMNLRFDAARDAYVAQGEESGEAPAATVDGRKLYDFGNAGWTWYRPCFTIDRVSLAREFPETNWPEKLLEFRGREGSFVFTDVDGNEVADPFLREDRFGLEYEMAEALAAVNVELAESYPKAVARSQRKPR